MPNYYIEPAESGYNIKDKRGNVVSGGHPTQESAEERLKQIDPTARPDVARVRHTPEGEPDKWRKE
jgi:hypothetical protein